jgi:hypothetical protein
MKPSEDAQKLQARHASFLSAPRTTLELSTLPPPVRIYVAQFGEVLKLEARRLLVDGVAYFELLRTEENDGDEEGAPDTFITGTIVDASGAEHVDLDFVQGLATFPPTPAQVEHDVQLTKFAATFFTRARLDGAELKPFESKLPAAIEREPDARSFKLEFEGKTYFAQAYLEAKAWEVLVYDAQGSGLGGCYAVGKEEFEVAEVELTRPLSKQPLQATSAARGHDDFVRKANPRVVI